MLQKQKNRKSYCSSSKCHRGMISDHCLVPWNARDITGDIRSSPLPLSKASIACTAAHIQADAPALSLLTMHMHSLSAPAVIFTQQIGLEYLQGACYEYFFR